MLRNTAITVLALAGLMIGCGGYKDSGGETYEDRSAQREATADASVKRFRAADPSLAKFFDNAHGYAVFPSVAKGALIVGGAHDSDGVVYQGGRVIGYATLSQGSVGAQIGGQGYAELIFFQGPANLSEFKRGELEFSAQASAVAATAGAGANADYEDGVAVFTLGEKGLMLEASLGGQAFTFRKK